MKRFAGRPHRFVEVFAHLLDDLVLFLLLLQPARQRVKLCLKLQGGLTQVSIWDFDGLDACR